MTLFDADEPARPPKTGEHAHQFWLRAKCDRQIVDGFIAFWSACPRRVNKAGARRAYAKAVKVASVAEIAAGLQRWVDWRAAKAEAGEWIPDPMHPATWLNGECWEDELVMPRRGEDGGELSPGIGSWN